MHHCDQQYTINGIIEQYPNSACEPEYSVIKIQILEYQPQKLQCKQRTQNKINHPEKQ